MEAALSPPAELSEGLTSEQLENWEKNGYLLIPDALSQAEVGELLAETTRMLNDFSLDDHPMTRFSTGEKSDHVGDDYFLTSGDKIRYFLEEDAVSDGKLNREKQKAVNKIGHGL